MGDGVEERFMVVHDKVNGQWGQGLTKHDELGDMGRLVPMRMEAY
jgi:hypothetical protein